MLSLLVTIAMAAQSGPVKSGPVNVPASGSLWIYAHAGDPAGDEFIRVWGAGGAATSESGGDNGEFSYGYLRFDTSKFPNGKPKKATLILHNIAPAGFSPQDAASAPLQARALIGRFEGANYGQTVVPGTAKTIFGNGNFVPAATADAPPEIDIDLLQGPGDFQAALNDAGKDKDHALFMALTSALDPSAGGRTSVYKVYSAATKQADMKPTLRLEF